MPDGTHLRIEPGAAERIAQAFETHADNLAGVAENLKRVTYSTGFAGFPSADELNIGFRDKAHRAIAHLQEQVDLTRGYAADIRAAGAAYVETESMNTATIDAAGTAVHQDTVTG